MCNKDMPKTIPDYSKSCIYKLVHKEDFNNDNIYVGSTTNFIQRKKSHKKSCNNINDKDHNLNVYKHIRENGNWENWVMIQIEPFSCNSKKELETRERYWIETLKSKLNCNIPSRSKTEYRLDNKNEIKEYHKQYRLDNADKIAEYKNQYRHNNRDNINEYHRQYYHENKYEITQKVKCNNCGSYVKKPGLAKHQKTNKCINFNLK